MSGYYNPQSKYTLPAPQVTTEILDNLAIDNITPDFRLVSLPLDCDPFSLRELRFALSVKKKDTAVGMDQISYSMIRNLPNEALEALCGLYNSFLQGHSIPETWKNHLIIPFLKAGRQPENMNSYRPISLASCLEKLFESLLKTRLEWQVENSRIFSELQTAFRKGHSITDSIAYLTSYVQLGYSKNQFTIGLFLDIKAAFDNVNIYTLHSILKEIGVSNSICNVIHNLLSNRQIYAKDQFGNIHGPKTATQGLIQGSPLSPYLFNIYTHRISTIVPTSVKILQYADDILVLTAGKTTREAINNMNDALLNISEWLNTLNLTISPEKSAALLFTKKTTRRLMPDLTINNVVIPWKTSTKYLGIIIQNNLSWTEQVGSIGKKIQANLNIMRASVGRSWGTDPVTLKMVYSGLIRSHLDFCCQALQPMPKHLSAVLDRLQFQALRLILGAMKSTPTNVLLAETCEFSLEHRRRWLTAKYILKIIRIENHPVIQIIKELTTYCHSNTGYWSKRLYPYLVSVHNYIEEQFRNHIKLPVFPCFHFNLKYQISDLYFTELDLKKNEDNNANFTHIVREKWPQHTAIFTDASRNPDSNKSAIGVYIPSSDDKFSSLLPSNTQIYTAEIMAIKKACYYVHNCGVKKVLLCSDSKTALQMICSNAVSDKSLYVTLSTRKLIVDLINEGVNIELAWVPSHTNIMGNERADQLAKEGTGFNIAERIRIDTINFLPVVKAQLWDQWNQEWKASTCNTGQWYASFQFDFPKTIWFAKFPHLGRKHITSLTRIRSGHCLMAKHKHRIGLAESPHCECGQVEDLNHIFFDCPINILPDYDIYKKLIDCKIPTPININTVLSSLNFDASIVLTTFLKKNKIIL